MGPFTLSIESALVKVYSEAGDFENAEKHLRSLSAGYTNVFRFLSDLNKKNWNSSYYIAVGELAYHQGKFVEAEIAFSKGLEAYESGFEVDIKSFDHDQIAAAGQSGSPYTLKLWHDEIYRRLSDIKLRLRKVNEAEFFAREALKKSLKYFGRSSISTSESMRQLAIVLLSHERNKDAIYLLNQALLGFNDAGVSAEAINLARTKKTLASAFIADERYADALTIYAELDRTIATYPHTARFIDTNSLDRVLALVRVGSLSEAEARAEQLLAATEARAGKKSKEATDAKLMLAMTLAEEKKDGKARGLFSTGMADLVEFEREAGQDSDGASSKERKYLAGYIESYLGLLARLYEKNPHPEIVTEAFALGDMARSSGVQKALNASNARANITNIRLAELARKEQDLNQQITFLSRSYKELAMQPAAQQLPGAQKAMKANIEELRKESKDTLHLIELDFPDYAQLISPKPVSLEKAQKALMPNEVLVAWFIGKKISYVWAASNTGTPQFKSLAITQSQLRKDITQLRKSLDPKVVLVEEIPEFNFALSHSLYDALFKPIQPALDNKNTLLLIPHDEIGQLPLGLLTTAEFLPNAKADLRFANYREAPWLIKKYAIANVPTATAMVSLRGLPKFKDGRFDFIAFADPLFNQDQAKAEEKQVANGDTGVKLASRGSVVKLRSSPNTAQLSSAEVGILPRLPDTKDEIEEIAKVFNVDAKRDIYLQKRASLEEVIKANLSNYKVVMFSTHGLVPGELDGLTQPALALTNPDVFGKKGDGLLKVDQILTLKLNADWVILSACNTGAGEGEGTEALSGLGRAFFFAGTRSLLVSSWPVDSEAARQLMISLFKRQYQEKAASKSIALQQASLSLMSHGGPDNKAADYSYAHPLFWAPFTMVGD